MYQHRWVSIRWVGGSNKEPGIPVLSFNSLRLPHSKLYMLNGTDMHSFVSIGYGIHSVNIPAWNRIRTQHNQESACLPGSHPRAQNICLQRSQLSIKYDTRHSPKIIDGIHSGMSFIQLAPAREDNIMVALWSFGSGARTATTRWILLPSPRLRAAA
jgi:hypothetical protein